MGWSLSDFNESSPAEVLRALAWKTHFREGTDRTILEAARMLGFWLLQPYDGDKQIKKPTDLIQYDFDPVTEPVKLTEEEKIAQQEKFARWDTQMKEEYGQSTINKSRNTS
ncbi:MAG: hypothetical protein AAFR36_21050 [Bacteroidota bacterium]